LDLGEGSPGIRRNTKGRERRGKEEGKEEEGGKGRTERMTGTIV